MSDTTPVTQRWFERLTPELFQTERSAIEHPKKEAERLGDVPPSAAMLAVSAHAERALTHLKKAMPETSSAGEQAGRLFSMLRDTFADRTLTHERSYRGTMLGMQHGIDLMRTMAPLAAQLGHEELSEFMEAWIAERTTLLERCQRVGAAWFNDHPEVADTFVSQSLLSRAKRAVLDDEKS